MKTQQFIAKTKSGIEVKVSAENTETTLKTNYPVKCVSTKQGAIHVIKLTAQEAKNLGITLPAKQKEALIVLEDQAGWKAFDMQCLKERYDLEQAKPKTLVEQREALYSEEYDAYSEEHFPGSKAWHRWNKAYKALKAFDEAHPEIKENLKKEKDGFIPTEDRMDI